MKVTLAKHGGLGGAVRLSPRVVDADCLAPTEAVELAGLIVAAKAAAGVGQEPGPGADRMSYTITVEDNDESTVLHQPHTNMTPAFKALRDWLEDHPKSK